MCFWHLSRHPAGTWSNGMCMLTLFTNRVPPRFSTTASSSSTSSSTNPLSLAAAAVHQLVASIQAVTSSLSRPVFFTYRPTMLSLMAARASMYCPSSAAS